MALAMLLSLLWLSPAGAQSERPAPNYSPREEPATPRKWEEGLAKQLLEEGYIRLGLFTFMKERSERTKDEFRELAFAEVAAMGGDLAAMARDVDYAFGEETGISVVWDTGDRSYRNALQRLESNSLTALQKRSSLWELTVEVWRREPDLAAKELAANGDFYNDQRKVRRLLEAVSDRNTSTLSDVLASDVDPSSFKDYAYGYLDYWDQKSLMTRALNPDRYAENDTFMLLAAAQGRFGWKPDVMEHFFSKADLREMLGTIVKIDYTRIFYALTDSGFDGEYLSRQPDVWGLVWGFVNQAANRNGRILEELLAMPSWRPGVRSDNDV